MNCVMCFSTASSLLELTQYLNNNTLKEILFVIPDSIIPELQDPIYACAKCLEQLSSFYKIKKSCLKNLSLFKHRKDILKETSNVKLNDLKIVMNCEKVPTRHEMDQEFNLISNFQDILPSRDIEEDGDEDYFTETFSNSSNDEESKTQRAREKRRFKCRDCDKAFTRRSDLVRHTRVHTGEKPYKCPTCQKTYTQTSALKTHTLTHTGQKPYECDICQKMFTRKGDLNTHERSHTNVRPYQCSVCNKAFTKSNILSTHMRIHTKKYPYECHVCQYKCTQSGTLKRHIRAHTGEKPYTCKFCQKSFTRLSTLKEHKLRLHNNDDSN